MSEEKPVLEANLMSIIGEVRLPRLEEVPYNIGVFSLLCDKKKIGEMQVVIGNAFKLGDAFRVHLCFYPAPTEEYNEFMGFKVKPDLNQVKPV